MTQPAISMMQQLRRLMFGLLVASLCFAALGLILAIGGSFSDIDIAPRLIFTPILVTIYSCLVLVSIQPIERGRLVILMWSTIVLATVVALGWGGLLWRSKAPSEAALKAMSSASVLLVAFTIAGQLMAQQVNTGMVRVFRDVLSYMVIGFAAFSILLIWSTWWLPLENVIMPLTFTGGMALFFAVVALGSVIRAMNKKRIVAEESLSSGKNVRLMCPRCATEQVLATGVAKCRSCRLAMLIEVTEPRCECGYLLYRLQANICPECGRPVQLLPAAPVVAE